MRTAAGAADLKAAYGLLGVSLGASRRELKQAYRRLARKWHPDRFSGDGNSNLEARAAERMKAINAAYELLQGAPPPSDDDVPLGGASPRDPAPDGWRPFGGSGAERTADSRAGAAQAACHDAGPEFSAQAAYAQRDPIDHAWFAVERIRLILASALRTASHARPLKALAIVGGMTAAVARELATFVGDILREPPLSWTAIARILLVLSVLHRIGRALGGR